jgi:two-component system chemotaxis sensor kinase CheA
VSGLDPIETFRQEAQDLLEQIEQGLLDLAHRPGDRDLVDAVFRGLHTLKGSGAMFGFDALAAFTHHCETACAPWPKAVPLRKPPARRC